VGTHCGDNLVRGTFAKDEAEKAREEADELEAAMVEAIKQAKLAYPPRLQA
jgi:hypothetical protein